MYHELRPLIPSAVTYNTLSRDLLTCPGEADTDIPNYVEPTDMFKLAKVFVHLGRVSLVGHIEDPPDDLPISTALDSEELAEATRFSNSEQERRDQGCFALLIESTKLLGQVLKNTSSRQSNFLKNQAFQLHEQINQLDNTLKSLILASENEAAKWDLDIQNQLFPCYSAILVLHQYHYKRVRQRSIGLEWDNEMHLAIKPIVDRVILACKEIIQQPEQKLDFASPFLLHSIYTVALAGSNQHRMSMENKYMLQKALEKLSGRWKAAGAYLEMLEAYRVLRL
ncbi:uncharacterized protein TRIVIDRAFT_201769 [Trichoderma virens Gv29-8]|uniref:Uncharacterized protein n=1 Tax=Hypocrea virens (strain Gv29-8 / FGSC 10586) TaxID=413071 RepID=G9MV15_HYPVG|nr:uncharacterized protein TRIVIDRAFT_201769 [Trichoderma virens Gv29-8]EHK21738.1 hypothetical protein TRIVIDRAFT_201769 [Trichoderma virens Gv29-8]UKZ55832.1 hypothetical protein TrVGV298_009656 [Trichoderma virens]